MTNQITKYKPAIEWHLFSLVIGFIAYTVVVVLVSVYGKDDNTASNITVVVLCACAVSFEIGMHFLADRISDLSDLNCSTAQVNGAKKETLSPRQKALFKRADTLFIIMLGAGSFHQLITLVAF